MYKIFLLLLIGMAFLSAQDNAKRTRVELTDGSAIYGQIIEETPTTITLQLENGASIKLNRSSIRSIEAGSAQSHRVGPYLMYLPTAETLPAGTAYLTDNEIFFPGITYAPVDNWLLQGGFSIIPGLSLNEQLKYVATKAGIRLSERHAVALGAFFTLNEFNAGMFYGAYTYGDRNGQITAMVGWGFSNNGNDFFVSDNALIGLGGYKQVSDHMGFMIETYFPLDSRFEFNNLPVTPALRFEYGKFTIDAGVMLVLEALQQGFPIPLLNLRYDF
ncbi:MAG: hypothetical protein D6677_07050 [Calditrichaeota bacterium]|nr:MAG: hypothetical protein D6677_07050 [Calditrichota bacterium]